MMQSDMQCLMMQSVKHFELHLFHERSVETNYIDLITI